MFRGFQLNINSKPLSIKLRTYFLFLLLVPFAQAQNQTQSQLILESTSLRDELVKLYDENKFQACVVRSDEIEKNNRKSFELVTFGRAAKVTCLTRLNKLPISQALKTLEALSDNAKGSDADVLPNYFAGELLWNSSIKDAYYSKAFPWYQKVLVRSAENQNECALAEKIIEHILQPSWWNGTTIFGDFGEYLPENLLQLLQACKINSDQKAFFLLPTLPENEQKKLLLEVIHSSKNPYLVFTSRFKLLLLPLSPQEEKQTRSAFEKSSLLKPIILNRVQSITEKHQAYDVIDLQTIVHQKNPEMSILSDKKDPIDIFITKADEKNSTWFLHDFAVGSVWLKSWPKFLAASDQRFSIRTPLKQVIKNQNQLTLQIESKLPPGAYVVSARGEIKAGFIISPLKLIPVEKDGILFVYPVDAETGLFAPGVSVSLWGRKNSQVQKISELLSNSTDPLQFKIQDRMSYDQLAIFARYGERISLAFPPIQYRDQGVKSPMTGEIFLAKTDFTGGEKVPFVAVIERLDISKTTLLSLSVALVYSNNDQAKKTLFNTPLNVSYPRMLSSFVVPENIHGTATLKLVGKDEFGSRILSEKEIYIQ
jgi:hypothetical protein